MTHTVNVTVVTTSQDFPAGTVGAGIVVTFGKFAPVTLATAPYNTVFSDVAAGDYTISAQLVDASNAPLGAAITGTVTVQPDAVKLDVPASFQIVVS